MAVAAITAETGRAAARVAPGVAVRVWLWGLAVLIGLMITVGGATRLTGSGLSITEWRPITGVLPPLSAGAWDEEFAKYRNSSQGRNLNRGISQGEFKSIYAWEWGHRLLGRLIGLYALGPLAWFWWRRAISSGLAAKLLGIAVLGGLQGGVGWIMVASGLEEGMVAVAPVKLTLHLLLASLLLGLVVWVAAGVATTRLATAGAGRRPRRAAGLAGFCLGLVALQVGLGGLVAGSKAGLTYNTWPLMDGRWLPSAETLFPLAPWAENFLAGPALVQLDHRLGAYAVVAALLVQAMVWLRSAAGSPGAARASLLAGIALAQAGLGIATLVLVVPLWAGLAHQALAMALLAAATLHLRRTLAEPSLGAAPAPAIMR